MKDSIQNNEPKNYLRTFFLNLFISAFIIITYVYVSEIYGSISTIFIRDSTFSIHFSITLLLFSFFSILAGPFHGLFDGFISELLFQLTIYHAIYIEWCILVAMLGLLVGIYKYKPLKFHDPMKIYYSFLALIVTSIVVSGIIILFQNAFYPERFSLETLIINYGFKFLVQALLSIVFLVPILLFLYDRILATEEKHLYYMILTHHPISASDHTFILTFGRTKIYFCSRCSGVISGGIIAMFFTHLQEKIFNAEFNGEIALLLCIIFPLPGLIDWGTQRLLLRKSSTESRLLTGFMIGNALHFMSFAYKYYYFILILLTTYFTVFGLLVYFGHKKEMKIFRSEMNELSSKEVNDE
ncbi:MAG: DUF2085 domain-containing protein [Promethearchaeota archaeon]